MKILFIIWNILFLMIGVKAQIQPPESSGFISNNNIRLFYREIGEGEPIIIHHGGLGLSNEYIYPFLSSLSSNYRLIFFDHRASGFSSGKVDSCISLDKLVSDLEALRQHFSLNKFILLGHSLGGLVSTAYAELYPQHIGKLVLINPIPPNKYAYDSVTVTRLKRLTTEETTEINELFASEEFKKYDPSVFDRFLKIAFSVYLKDKSQVENLNFAVNKHSFSIVSYNEILLNTVDWNMLEEGISNLVFPTLVIHGDYDPIPNNMVEEFSNKLPNGLYILFKDTGHFPFMEKTEDFLKIIKKFID